MSSGALAYAVSWRGANGTWQPHTCPAITPAFPVLAGWSFPTECIAILKLTGGSVLAEWDSALRSAGLRDLFTWDKPVPWQHMLAFADDLLQIELGTNNFDGCAARQQTPPRLRGYGVGATVEYLMNRRLADDAGGKAQAVYLPEMSPSGHASGLVPTIDSVTINEDDPYIALTGQFGREQGLTQAPEVRVGGTPARPAEPLLARADGPVGGGDKASGRAWRSDGTQAGLRRDQLARGGYVQVVNGDRWSNAVQITFWEIPITVTSTITGGLTLQRTVTLTLRADVRGNRLQPDGDRWNGNPTRGLVTSADSRAVFTASAEISQTVGRDTATVSWSGSGGVASAPSNRVVSGDGTLDWAARRWKPVVSVAAASSAQRTLVMRFAPTVGTVVLRDTTEPKPVSFYEPTLQLTALEFVFDERWGLLAGSYANAAEPVTLLGDRTRTTTLNWGAVPASYSPVDGAFGGV